MATQGHLRPTLLPSADDSADLRTNNEGGKYSVILEHITEGKETSLDLPLLAHPER